MFTNGVVQISSRGVILAGQEASEGQKHEPMARDSVLRSHFQKYKDSC